MNSISFIVIGRNDEKSLSRCFNAIKKCIIKFNKLKNVQIIYVDSNSSDNSVNIAKEHGVDIVEIIESNFLSASLGRYIGLKHAKYENLIFLDSDMEIDEDWLIKSEKFYLKYHAVIGERIDYLYDENGVLRTKIENVYNIEKTTEVRHIGGFLMINKSKIGNTNYTILLKDEEEKDFYAKFYSKIKIFSIPITAYIHHDTKNTIRQRIMLYIKPYSKTGYIVSFFNSIKNDYFLNYFLLQKKYFYDFLLFLLFMGSFLNVGFIIVYLFIILLNIKRLKGSIVTQLFFPYKLYFALRILSKKINIKYKYQNNIIKIN